MALKQASFKITKGMNQDLSKQVFSPDTAFRLYNIKNQILDSNNLEVLVNEKGTKQIGYILGYMYKTSLSGKILGVVECTSDMAVIFVREPNNISVIYKATYIGEDNIKLDIIAKGNFNFGDRVNGLFCYEHSELQKVYWVDGVNQLRYINIADSNFKVNNSNGKLPITEEIYLNTSPEFKLGHTIKVERIPGGGIFTAGVIQYAFTYYMKKGAETSIVDMTPLYYIGEEDRGLPAGETVGCSYKVVIENPDTRFDYIRLYSIQRTSIEGVPVVKIVKDIKLK